VVAAARAARRAFFAAVFAEFKPFSCEHFLRTADFSCVALHALHMRCTRVAAVARALRL
jgi:hypothetical protein